MKVSNTPEYGSSDSPYQVNMADKSFEHSHDHSEKHKKSKKKKKKKDREKRHKHHKKERHHRRESSSSMLMEDDSVQMVSESNMQLYYSSMSTSSAISSSPATKPMVQMPPEQLQLQQQQQQQKTFHNLQNVPVAAAIEHKLEVTSMQNQQQLSPMTPPSSNDLGREPRTCVLKLKQSKSPLTKLCDALLKTLEKRDPHNFFAWPVSDDIGNIKIFL